MYSPPVFIVASNLSLNVSNQGTDRTMLDKMVSHHGKNKLFLVPKSKFDDTFGIDHFAGPVRYNCNGN